MKKRKEPVFTIGSFFRSKFEMFFRCKKNLSRRFAVRDQPLHLLTPFALFPSLLIVHRSPIHHSRITKTLSLGSFYFLSGSSKCTVHLFTIHSYASSPPFSLALSTFYFTLKNSPFTYSP